MRSYSVNQADKQDDKGELGKDILFIGVMLAIFVGSIAFFIS